MATNNETINLKIQVDASQAQQSTVNYKAKIKELKDQMAELLVETNGLADATEEQRAQYESLAKEAGSLTDALGDVSARIRANADDYQMFNAALEGLKGGAAVAQGLVGTLDLLGISNTGVEQVVKTLMSLQGVMNSINTVQQIFNKDSKIRIALTKLMTTSTVAQTGATTTATVAQRALNVAMNAMPIMAIVSAAALLITALTNIGKKNKEVAETTDEATDAQKRYNEEVNKSHQNYKNVGDQLSVYIQRLKFAAKGSGEEAAILKNINSLLGINVDNYDDALKATKDWNSSIEGVGVGLAIQRVEELNAAIKRNTEEGKDNTALIRELAAANIELTQAQDRFQQKYKKVEQASKATKKAVEEETEVWHTLKQLQDKYISTTSEELGKVKMGYYKDITQTFDESNSIIANYLTGQLQDYKQYSKEWIEASKLLLDTQKQIEIDSYTQQYEDGKISWELYQSEKYRIEQEYAQKEKDLQTSITNHQKEEDVKRLEATQTRLEASAEILNTFSSFTQSMMDAELIAAEGNEKKQKEIKKKYATSNAIMQIGKIGIDTALAIMGVWSAYGEIPFAGPIIAGALSAAIGALGIANTAKAIQEKNKIMKAARGAYVVGASHTAGGVNMELEGGEMVLNKNVAKIPQFRAIASAMNVATGGVSLGGGSLENGAKIGITKEDVQNIVQETVAGIAAIPVVVSAQTITETQRRVGVTTQRSQI